MTPYQHTPKASKSNGFNWQDGSPSIFAADRGFVPIGKQQQSASVIASNAVAAKTKRDGKNPGTITNLSRKERILADRWGGSVSRAVPT